MKKNSSADKTLSHIDLNESQKSAVNHFSGPLLVIAGAGSGKTRVITYRIINLLEKHQIDARSVIGLTFTNKAAGEMSERIMQRVSIEKKPFIGTFHAYCLQLLKSNAHLLNRPHFTILDSDDQQALLNTIIKRSRIEKKTNAKSIAHQISMYKNNAVNGDNQHFFVDPLFREILLEYEREKRVSNYFDFDDLLLETVQLFTKNKEFKAQHQATIRHVLVDEYQDTNSTQHTLLKAMALEGKKFMIDSLCAVGDEDQSIYSWRGATISNMLDFAHDFPGTKTIKIEQNYRCSQSILEVANTIISHNYQRNPKNLWSTKKDSGRARVLQCFSGYQEGAAITHLVSTARKRKSSTHSVAVLYRAHYQSRAIEEALIRQSIPYTIIGGIEFYERKEIKDILAYLKLLVNPFDRVSFFRVINCPLRGLGDKFQGLFYQTWQEQPFYSYAECAEYIFSHASKITGAKNEGLQNFLTVMQEIKKHAHNARSAMQQCLTAIHYFSYLQNNFEKEEAESKVENIKELLRAAEHFEKNGIATVEQFLDEIALIQNHNTENNHSEAPVTLMTIHAAKGLEFDIVIIAGLEEGIFPSSRSVIDSALIEEERRLLYVAITRAKEYLLLTHAKNRHTFGSMTDQLPSRFLSELPKNIVMESAHYWNEYQIQDFFCAWFNVTPKTHVYTAQTATQIDRKPKASTNTVSPSLTHEANTWKIRQPVKHKTFGIGIIQAIEKKDSTTPIVTVQFSSGIKKVKATFLNKL